MPAYHVHFEDAAEAATVAARHRPAPGDRFLWRGAPHQVLIARMSCMPAAWFPPYHIVSGVWRHV